MNINEAVEKFSSGDSLKKSEIKESLYRNSKEYFRDETDIIPTKDQINNYIKNVDNLKNKIEVLEASLKKTK